MQATEFSRRQGANLRALRKMRGLTVNELADLIGASPDAVRRYERGVRTVTTELLMKWCVCLNCSEQSILVNLDPRTASEDAPTSEFRNLTAEESRIMRYLATQWDGDVHALILAMRLYAALPEEGRAAVIMEMILQRDKYLTPEEYPVGMDYIEQALGGLYK